MYSTFRTANKSLRINIPWGNATGTLVLEPCVQPEIIRQYHTLVYNDYNFTFNAAQNNIEFKLNSGIRDISLKQDFDLYPYTGHKLRFGSIYTFHKFTPSVVSGKQDSRCFRPNNAQVKYGHEAAVYVQDDWELNDKVKLNAGIRYSWFQQIGPYKRNTQPMIMETVSTALCTAVVRAFVPMPAWSQGLRSVMPSTTKPRSRHLSPATYGIYIW